ncbi:hypothetical protein NB694_000751 [Pantoea ananatis]|uniref:hypothetical protein n=1 Tax=Pantoea ananas TaxID=553 RepID=UPI0021F7F69F|nr:hypothetical protein [Pantoea ananatis]MCW0310951.1 hypothetical protein [Pantoea ananatis]
MIGVIITLCAIAISFSMLKPDKPQLKGIKEWVARDDWSGDVIIVSALNWYQNDAKYGDDYFYTFYFNATIYGVKKRYSAICAVKFSQIHKIKKGLKFSVKYACDNPPKMAAVNLE